MSSPTSGVLQTLRPLVITLPVSENVPFHPLIVPRCLAEKVLRNGSRAQKSLQTPSRTPGSDKHVSHRPADMVWPDVQDRVSIVKVTDLDGLGTAITLSMVIAQCSCITLSVLRCVTCDREGNIHRNVRGFVVYSQFPRDAEHGVCCRLSFS